MKKIFAGVLGLFLLVFPFVGCGQKEEKEQVDLSKFPNYVEPDKAAYAFGFNEMTAIPSEYCPCATIPGKRNIPPPNTK